MISPPAIKMLPKEPISQDGHRLYEGDTVKVLRCCNCSQCAPFKNSFAYITATQDSDPWLYARECKGGEEPLLRLRMLDGHSTMCCFKACNVESVYSKFHKEISVTVQVNSVSKQLCKKFNESLASFGARIADTIDSMEKGK